MQAYILPKGEFNPHGPYQPTNRQGKTVAASDALEAFRSAEPRDHLSVCLGTFVVSQDGVQAEIECPHGRHKNFVW
jgi:hypothetical protein